MNVHLTEHSHKMNRHTDIQTYRHTDIQTYRHTGIQTYRHTDIQTQQNSHCRFESNHARILNSLFCLQMYNNNKASIIPRYRSFKRHLGEIYRNSKVCKTRHVKWHLFQMERFSLVLSMTNLNPKHVLSLSLFSFLYLFCYLVFTFKGLDNTLCISFFGHLGINHPIITQLHTY